MRAFLIQPVVALAFGFILFALAGLIAGWEFMEKRTKKLR